MQPTEFQTGVIHPVDCAKEAWQLIKPNYWLLMAIFAVGAIIAALTLEVLLGAMVCGMMYCFLRQIDGETVSFEDLWKGLGFFWPGLLVTVLFVVPIVTWTVALFVTIYLPLLMTAVSGKQIGGDEILAVAGGAFAVDLVVALLMVSFHTLLTFSFPLVVDRGLSGFEPVKVSARAVWRNLGGVCGLIGVNFVLALIGEAMCGVGIYLVAPLLMATTLVAYRKVFPRMTPVDLNPPAPNLYSELR